MGEVTKTADVEVITPGMPAYPARLKELPDFPKTLYCIGNVKLLENGGVSIVGSRKTNAYGRGAAVRFAGSIAEAGVTVVSGMARGIDTCAHRGALDVCGDTVAVLGCGVDVCYPADNAELKGEIEAKGLIVSEYPPGRKPERYHFPQRNRIISGISEAVLVIQARNGSGALITAETAAEQGREVYSVPGNVDSQYNTGSNKLIQEGAAVALSPGDILQLMGLDIMDGKRAEEVLGNSELSIYRTLEERGEMTIDELCSALQRPPSYVSGIVAVMEMKGIVFSAMGKIFIAKDQKYTYNQIL